MSGLFGEVGADFEWGEVRGREHYDHDHHYQYDCDCSCWGIGYFLTKHTKYPKYSKHSKYPKYSQHSNNSEHCYYSDSDLSGQLNCNTSFDSICSRRSYCHTICTRNCHNNCHNWFECYC